MQSAIQTFDALMDSGIGTARKLQLDIHNAFEARRTQMLVSMGRIEQSVQQFEHIAMGEIGLRPKAEIPIFVYHYHAARFKEKDLKAGITHTTGYECWQPGNGFYEDWCKQNQSLQYREAKRCLQSSVIVPGMHVSLEAAKREGAARRLLAEKESKPPAGRLILPS